MGRIHQITLMIRESHLDTFGHVNNATYLQILEEARWDMITEAGYGLAEVRRLKKGPTILEINLKFHRELTNREHIRIVTEVLEPQRKIGKLRQRIFKADDQLACEAVFTVGLFDLERRRLIAPTPEWLRVLGDDSPGGESGGERS